MSQFRTQPPPGFAAYKTTPEFTEATVPKALLNDHDTKPGVWAVIEVLEGRLAFRLADPPAETVVKAGETLACPPQARHHVTPLGQVRFRIAFWR